MYAACAIIWYLSLYANPSSNAVAMMFTSFCDFYKSASLLAQNWHVALRRLVTGFLLSPQSSRIVAFIFLDVLKCRSQNWHVGCFVRAGCLFLPVKEKMFRGKMHRFFPKDLCGQGGGQMRSFCFSIKKFCWEDPTASLSGIGFAWFLAARQARNVNEWERQRITRSRLCAFSHCRSFRSLVTASLIRIFWLRLVVFIIILAVWLCYFFLVRPIFLLVNPSHL